MNKETNILQTLTKRLRPRVSLSEKKLLHSEREWVIGLGVVTGVFLCAATYLGYHFYTHLNEEPSQVVDEIKTIEYKRKEVESILNQYKENKATFDQLRTETHTYQPLSVPETQARDVTPLAEEHDGQYSSDAMIAPVVE